MIVLGEKLENPYSLANMKQAAENLASTNSKGGQPDITPSHLYVKFKPSTYEELELLHTSDTMLILFNYPLDYEIKENGNYYHDPEVPQGKPTYHYTSVPIDYDFPADVAYKVLEEVYIPGEDDVTSGRTVEEANALEREAFRITGNLPASTTTNATSNGRTEALTWRPSGRLRVWDDIIGSYTTSTQEFSHWEYYDCEGGGEEPIQHKGISSDLPSKQPQAPSGQCRRAIYTTEYETHSGSYIPLEGILVRMHTFVKIAWGTTTSTGNYSSNLTFLAFPAPVPVPVQYSFVWETNKYRIFEAPIDASDWIDVGYPVMHNGPLRSSSWNYDFGSGNSLAYGHMHRAGYRYFYKNIGGLKKPPSIFGRLILSYKDVDGTGINYAHYWRNALSGMALTNIIVWGRQDDNTRKITNRIFGTTIHELAHSSHNALMQSLLDFLQVDEIIVESWAEAVEWHINNVEYDDLNYVDYGLESRNNWSTVVSGKNYWCEHKQYWAAGGGNYTPLFVDMVDNYDQKNLKSITLPGDDISGHTLGGIESGFLKNVYNIEGLRTRILSSSLTIGTDTEVNTYFDYY